MKHVFFRVITPALKAQTGNTRCLAIMLAGFAVGCGPAGGAAHHGRRPMQNEAVVFAQFAETFDAAEAILALSEELMDERRLRNAIALARHDLALVAAACNEQRIRGQASCSDAPGAAAIVAAQSLNRSVSELAEAMVIAQRFRPRGRKQATKGKQQGKKKRAKVSCTPKPRCPHLGGDRIHNMCADREPPNLHAGCDVLVAGRHFDALAPGRVLWEIKTESWTVYSDFLQQLTLLRDVSQAIIDNSLARSCGYGFVMGVADSRYYTVLASRIPHIVVRHVPRCARTR